MKVKTSRCKGAGTLYKSGKVWYGRYYVEGKAVNFSTHCTNREEAERVLNEKTHPMLYQRKVSQLEHIKTQIAIAARDEDEYQRITNRVKVDELFLAFVTEKNLPTVRCPRTEIYYSVTAQFVKWIKENKPHTQYLDEITKETAATFLTECNQKRGSKRHNMVLIHLKTVWNALAPKHKLAPIWKGIQTIAAYDVDYKQNLTEAEFASLERVMSKKPDDKLLFTITKNTACRLSDACLMKWENVSDDFKTLNFIPFKTRRTGHKISVPISTELETALRFQRLRVTDSEYVIPHMAHLYQTASIRPHLRLRFDKAGIKRKNEKGVPVKSWHSLRVWAISRMINSGISISVVKKIVGHFDEEQTLHYLKADNEKLRNAISKLSDADELTISIGGELAVRYKALRGTMTDSEFITSLIACHATSDVSRSA